MKLILMQEIDGLGAPGDVVEVKAGYGRNYLVPRGLATQWTRGGQKTAEQPGQRDLRVLERHGSRCRRSPGCRAVSVATVPLVAFFSTNAADSRAAPATRTATTDEAPLAYTGSSARTNVNGTSPSGRPYSSGAPNNSRASASPPRVTASPTTPPAAVPTTPTTLAPTPPAGDSPSARTST